MQNRHTPLAGGTRPDLMLWVPLRVQEEDFDCGFASLAMVLDYFSCDPSREVSIQHLKSIAGLRPGRCAFTVQLAIAAAKLEFRAEFYSKSMYGDSRLWQLPYYRSFAVTQDEALQMVKTARQHGVSLCKREIALDELLSRTSENCVPVTLLDWSIVKEHVRGYVGHYVTVVGHDERFVRVNDPGFLPHENYPISRQIFEAAMGSPGADKHVLFIHRPEKITR